MKKLTHSTFFDFSFNFSFNASLSCAFAASTTFITAMTIGFAGTATADAGQDALSESFQVISVTDNISMLQGKGGNIGLFQGDDGLVMIDDDYQEMSPLLEKTLEQFGGAEKLSYLVNTHWHGNHTQGNKALGKHTTIVAHENVRQRLATPQELKFFGSTSEAYPEVALPSVTYQQLMHLHINDEDVVLVHFPGGHTDGDTVVFFKNSDVVHMGDHFFNGFYPFVDIEHGGNVLLMADNISAILDMIDESTKVIPGHGPLGNKQQLTDFRDMLMGTSYEILDMRDAGMSLEEIKKAHASNEKWASWGNGFIPPETWVELVLASFPKDTGNAGHHLKRRYIR